MRAKLVNEAIKHLPPKSDEEIKIAESNLKVVFFHKDTDEFEYKGKKRIYTSTPSIARFLKTKDYLVYVNNGKPYGYSEADYIADTISAGYGATYQNKNMYLAAGNHNKKFLKTLCAEKYPVNESIKHLPPKSDKEIRDGIMALPPQERLLSAVRHDIEFTDEEMEQYKKDMYDHVMQKHPKFRLKAAKIYNVALSSDDIDKTEQDLVKEFQQTYKTQKARDTVLVNTIRIGDAGDLKDIKYMLAGGADVNCNDGAPLITAVEKAYKELRSNYTNFSDWINGSAIKMLLQYGADPTLNDRLAIKMIKEKIKEIEKNREHREYFTAWEKKQIMQYQQILKLFRDYESKINK